MPCCLCPQINRYVNGQVHKRLGHPLYEIHWVWSGSTMESKQQTMRDAMRFWDPPGEGRRGWMEVGELREGVRDATGEERWQSGMRLVGRSGV